MTALKQPEPPGRIHGRVRGPGGQPVAGAFVRILEDGIVVDLQRTDARGEFTSRLLFAGCYRIEATAEGAAGAVDGVEVVLGRTTSVEIPLSPA